MTCISSILNFRSFYVMIRIKTEAVVRRCSIKKVFLKFRNIHGETRLRSSTLLKKRSGSGAFL